MQAFSRHGVRFTFTAAQEHSLRALVATLEGNLRVQPVGWRVLVVQDVTSMKRIIAEAIGDAHRKENQE